MYALCYRILKKFPAWLTHLLVSMHRSTAFQWLHGILYYGHTIIYLVNVVLLRDIIKIISGFFSWLLQGCVERETI